jgi:thiamine pyrophosphate-dependent acetolactate synthase large subunit-like protein
MARPQIGGRNTDVRRTVIHIDEMPADVDNDYQPAAELRGDIAATLLELTRLLSGLHLSQETNAAIAQQRDALLRIDDEARAHPATDAGLNPAAVVLKIRELVDDDATVACDVGSHYIYGPPPGLISLAAVVFRWPANAGRALPWAWPRRWCGQAPRWYPFR